MKTRERELARDLRRSEGASIKEIARQLCVSSSSVSRWVRDIELTPDQIAALVRRNPAYNRQLNGWLVMAARRRKERERAQEMGRDLARRGDVLHVAGCMLYWAEGAKDRNQLVFSNSDPEMIRFFVGFLRTYFDIPDGAFRLRCYLFSDHLERQHEVEQVLLSAAKLSRSSLHPSVVNRYSKSSKRKRFNVLPFGTCRVVVSRTAVVQSIFGAIQEYAGFRRDGWLE